MSTRTGLRGVRHTHAKGEKRIEGAGWDGAQHVRAPLEVGIACAKPWRGAGLRWGGFESDLKASPSRTENGAAQGTGKPRLRVGGKGW